MSKTHTARTLFRFSASASSLVGNLNGPPCIIVMYFARGEACLLFYKMMVARCFAAAR